MDAADSMPGAALAMRDGLLSGVATGFYEVKCAQGFTCVSKVSVFGEDHSGAYEERPGIEVDERVKNAYEWGCPARGVVASSGECRDNGSSGATTHWARSSQFAGQPCTHGGNATHPEHRRHFTWWQQFVIPWQLAQSMVRSQSCFHKF